MNEKKTWLFHVVPYFIPLIMILAAISFSYSEKPIEKTKEIDVVNTQILPTATNTTKDIQLQYIERNLEIIQIERDQLKNCCFSLSSDETTIDISSPSWKEDELSKLDRLIYFSSERISCPTGWKPICKYSQEINYEFVVLRKLGEDLLFQKNIYNGIEIDIKNHLASANEKINKFEEYLFLKLASIRKE